MSYVTHKTHKGHLLVIDGRTEEAAPTGKLRSCLHPVANVLNENQVVCACYYLTPLT